jgi:hypothetical protein
MITIFDKQTRDELVQRIGLLNENCKPRWGKMNVYQMSRHCTIWNDWVLGKKDFVYRQDFLGKLFGKMALKDNTKNDKPLGKNMPAGRAFKVREIISDLPVLQDVWKDQIALYDSFSNDKFIHDFFGKMTREQIGIFAFKHNDHHLRQFNA